MALPPYYEFGKHFLIWKAKFNAVIVNSQRKITNR